MKHTYNLAVILICGFITCSTQASVIYDVTDTSVINCSGAPHGLWTSGDISGGSCSNYFSIGGLFTLHNDDANSDNWYATLESTATNPQNVNADINLTFTGFEDAWGSYKQEGGAPYNPATMDFFTDVLGTIDISGTTYDIDSFVGSHAFQYGQGANAKDANEFGASAWVQSADINSHHWDLNLTFIPQLNPDLTAEIPEPSSLLLFGLALLGLGAIRKRQQK